MTDAHSAPDALSPAGRRRRQALLDELVTTMGQHHRRRRRRAAATGAIGIMALTLTVALLAHPLAPTATGPTIARDDTGPPTAPPITPFAAPPAATIELVRTDPTIMDRFSAPSPRRSIVVVVDDDRLLTELAAIDRPAGLIRTGGHVRLTSNVVSNEL